MIKNGMRPIHPGAVLLEGFMKVAQKTLGARAPLRPVTIHHPALCRVAPPRLDGAYGCRQVPIPSQTGSAAQ